MSGISSATAMLVAGVGSSALSAGGKILSGQREKTAYDQNADIVKLNTDAEAAVNEEKTSAVVARQRSAYAAAGVDVNSGSPLLIMAAARARGAQQNVLLEEAGDEKAAQLRYEGKIAAFDGTLSGIGAFLQGMTGDLTAYGKLTNNPTPSGTSPENLGLSI